MKYDLETCSARLAALVFVACATLGCRDHDDADGHAHADGSAHADEHAHGAAGDEHGGDEHADEVHLAPGLAARFGVELDVARLETLRPRMRVPARIAFNRENMAHVGSPVRGRVVELSARLGDEVQLGQPLCVVESAELGAAQNEYLLERSAALSAEPAVDLARNAHERALGLYEKSRGIALTEVQKREAEFRAAQSALVAARTRATSARSQLQLLGLSEERVAKLEATGVSDPRHTVFAPIAGQVVEREVTLGELVGPEREALLVLAEMSHLWILADVPESKLREVVLGARAEVLLGQSGDHRCTGQVDFISPTLDPRTRCVQVRIRADDRHTDLRPGLFAQAEIETRAEPEHSDHAHQAGEHEPVPVLCVPESAVRTKDGATFVFVPVADEPDTFAKRVIRCGEAVGGRVPVHSGLAAGETFVARGSFVLEAELGKHGAAHEH